MWQNVKLPLKKILCLFSVTTYSTEKCIMTGKSYSKFLTKKKLTNLLRVSLSLSINATKFFLESNLCHIKCILFSKIAFYSVLKTGLYFSYKMKVVIIKLLMNI